MKNIYTGKTEACYPVNYMIKEVSYKITHKCCSVLLISEFKPDTDVKFSFCEAQSKILLHLLLACSQSCWTYC